MAKIQPITSITIDDVDVPIDTLPEGIRPLINVFEEWTQREMDAADELQLVRAAKDTLSRQIVNSYRQFQAEAAAAQAAPAPAGDEAVEKPAPAPGPATAEDLKEPENTVAVTGDDAE